MKNLVLCFISFLPFVLFCENIFLQKIEQTGVEKHFSMAIEETIVMELGKRKGYTVFTTDEIKKLTGFAESGENLGCDKSEECLIEIGNKLSAHTLISGKVGKLGDEYILTLNTVDLKSQTVGKRTALEAKTLASLKDALPSALDKILGTAEEKPVFTLEIKEGLHVAVLPLTARGIEKHVSGTLSQILNSQLSQIKGLKVTGQDDIKAMMKKIAFDEQLNCVSNMECMIEIGAAFGASKLVTGSVGKINNTYVVSLQLIDTRKAEVLNRVLEHFVSDPKELKNAIKLLAYKIVGSDLKNTKGDIDISFNVENATLKFGSEDGEVKESKYIKTGVLPGRYNLTVTANPEDYFPLRTDVFVIPGETNTQSLAVLKKDALWYKTWWFWTAAGIVTASAGTTAYFLSRDKEHSGIVRVTGEEK